MEYNLYLSKVEWKKLKLLQRVPKLFDQINTYIHEDPFNQDIILLTTNFSGSAPEALLIEMHTTLDTLPKTSYQFYTQNKRW
jgi:hypothetical protein